MIRFNDVSKRYPGTGDALRNVYIDISTGEFVFLTGHSGAGKSTLLRLIALLERPTRGQIVIGGYNLNQIPRSKVPYFRRNVGMVFQNHRLLMDRTVFDNVALPMVIAGNRHQEIARRVRAALDKVGLLKKERVLPPHLSEGEQQRVGIARAVVARPSILLADEPTGNLDPLLSTEIVSLFGEFNQVGVTVLMASHDVALVRRSKRRTLVIQEGRVSEGYFPPPNV
ncbi:MAG: cell division ATP-binding protein FtsE [Gammaproteobacteria bacterium]|nr:cell division ATP-binding protein FtsE [Gammaproteobacteria bacterium]